MAARHKHFIQSRIFAAAADGSPQNCREDVFVKT
jgi:hypothetical protein